MIDIPPLLPGGRATARPQRTVQAHQVDHRRTGTQMDKPQMLTPPDNLATEHGPVETNAPLQVTHPEHHVIDSLHDEGVWHGRLLCGAILHGSSSERHSARSGAVATMTRYLLPKATSVRAQIEELADEIRELSDGMPPKEEALAAIDTHIEHEANSVKIRPSAFTGGAGPAVSAYPESAHVYARKFFPDVIGDRLRAEVEALYRGEVTNTDDRRQERLEAQRLELERQEESLIREAAAAGKNIPRRSDANPAIMLAD
jgi:hypothetical protein